MEREQSLEQLIARTEHPEWATAQGRINHEVRVTLMRLSLGEAPSTALGGLVTPDPFGDNAMTEARTVGEIAAYAHISPVEKNSRGDTIKDVLADLIEIGWVEEVGTVSELDRLIGGTEVPAFPGFRLLTPPELFQRIGSQNLT